MKEKYYLYQVTMKDDLSDELIERMAEFMNIEFNYEEVDKAMECEDLYSIDSVCIFRDKEDRNRLVLLDCKAGYNYFHDFVVVCRDDEHEQVKAKLIEITSELRVELDESPIYCVYNDIRERNAYYDVMKRTNLKYPFEINNTPSWKNIKLDKVILLVY